jgi:hypothetical protein
LLRLATPFSSIIIVSPTVKIKMAIPNEAIDDTIVKKKGLVQQLEESFFFVLFVMRSRKAPLLPNKWTTVAHIIALWVSFGGFILESEESNL